MNSFIHAIDGFYTNHVYYTATDSLYIENKHWENLDKAGLFIQLEHRIKLECKENRLQGKNDYKDGGTFYGLFLAPKLKYSLTLKKFGNVDEHKTFKGFANVSDKLNRKEHFFVANGAKLLAKVRFS